MFAIKSRKNKIKTLLEYKLGGKLSSKDIDDILNIFDVYQQNNLDTIDKLKRQKTYESKRISGALKQTINAHGPITALLIGSATKRIYGSLLNNKKENLFKRIINKIWGK